ncbi:hypothetical protein [Mycoplasma nasistruthionis]|uniref:Uncharacterized protein n=1 Tax=Mycoplasma nasistruthionis TaxID=353852 RepID=A0A4Y6I782_9MOLU|nr:hypothetical protein [Mycoplasma nasistruthionis]QCZ36984.1 hypothetical protein FG904_03220 [Mycoplasma nasistruthionis]QDF65252.1 hypothetical protein FIV53_03155 [Mycoplasma nasistruthionis]
MKLNQLNKVSENEKKNLNPGFAFTTLLTALPAILTGINTVVGIFKSMFSSAGSVKTKENEIKWDSSAKKAPKVMENYILF